MLLFHFSNSPEHPSSRQGLDMLLMALSLDQPCAAIYSGAALGQLLQPTNAFNPLKKITMLAGVFDFTEIYVDEAALADHQITLSELRIPAIAVGAEELAKIQQSAQHRINF